MKAHTHTHTHAHKHPLFFGKACALPCTQTGTPSFSSFCHVPLYSPVFHLTLQVSSKPSHDQRTLVAQCLFSFFFLTHVFIWSLQTWTASAACFIYVASYFLTLFHLCLSFILYLFRSPPSNQTPLMNCEADTCEKATTTLKMSGNVPQNLRLVTCHLLNGTGKWKHHKGLGSWCFALVAIKVLSY